MATNFPANQDQSRSNQDRINPASRSSNAAIKIIRWSRRDQLPVNARPDRMNYLRSAEFGTAPEPGMW
jgi:hypothetical protein